MESNTDKKYKESLLAEGDFIRCERGKHYEVLGCGNLIKGGENFNIAEAQVIVIKCLETHEIQIWRLDEFIEPLCDHYGKKKDRFVKIGY